MYAQGVIVVPRGVVGIHWHRLELAPKIIHFKFIERSGLIIKQIFEAVKWNCEKCFILIVFLHFTPDPQLGEGVGSYLGGLGVGKGVDTLTATDFGVYFYLKNFRGVTLPNLRQYSFFLLHVRQLFFPRPRPMANITPPPPYPSFCLWQ